MTTLRHLDNVRLACLHAAIAVLLAGLLLPQGTAAQEPNIAAWHNITLVSMDCGTGMVAITVDVEELVGPLRIRWYGLDGSNTEVQAGSAIVEETWPYTGSLPFQFTMFDLSQVHSLFITADIDVTWGPTYISVGFAVPCGTTPPVDPTVTWGGKDITVAPADGVTITFEEVLWDGGNTTVTPTTDAPALPNGYIQVGGVFYEIATTATFTGLATVCFNYDPSAEGAESFRLMHYENERWVDVTSSNDGAGTLCGVVSSFSPFALVISPSVPVVREDCLNGGWQAYGYANQGLCLRDVLKPND